MRDLPGLCRRMVPAAGAALLGWAVWAASVPGLPRFRDVTADAGVGFVNRPSKTSRKYLIESMVGGVAVLDYDGDGLLDLYFVNGAKLEDPMPPGKDPDKSDARYWNRLYRNLGGFRFEDVTAKAGVAGSGYGMGAAAGDFDNDGHRRPVRY
jgi:enediyne biosynthesis protein E4